ncbi:hypothetical protein U1Q18_047016 [Sarracenia purpurea var. burkii]
MSDKKREGKEKDGATNIWDCDSPLYDSYELVSLSHVIERHITTAPPFIGGSRRLSSKVCHSSAVNPSPKQDVGASKEDQTFFNGGMFWGIWGEEAAEEEEECRKSREDEEGEWRLSRSDL